MRARLPLFALVGVTAIWGYTFVPVQEAVLVFPVFAFLAVRFAVSTVAIAPFALGALRRTPRTGILAGCAAGVFLALGYGLQTAGLELTTVTSTGFITGLYVVFTPLLALALFRTRVPRLLWVGIALSIGGLALLVGVPGGSAFGNALVLGGAAAQGLQIAVMERFAPRWDARVLTFVQMAVSTVGFAVLAFALGDLSWPRSGVVWYAVVASGVFSGALGYLVATWVQARVTAARAALVFTLEAPFAALFGVALLSERLGWAGWTGCAVMLVGILLAEPATATRLRRFPLLRPAIG
ncbi:MAG: DMT family transporter [Thermoleophilia bacterium]|nr:DMT family transporter [Thermoleophilia bacterium]